MRKVRLPEFDSFEDAYYERYNTVSSVDYFNGFIARICNEDDYIYGFISPTGYYDEAIVKTDDIKLRKNISRESLKRVYEKVVKQLCKKYEEWVDGLFIKGE